jgi:Macrocin-O-methyltransferase (TylF)
LGLRSHPYRARAECALDACTMYSTGDYFEFGSDGMSTFRNFLTAFDLFDLPKTLPDTRFYAFDIFGKVEQEKDLPEFSKTYFDSWKDVTNDKLQEAHDHIASHNIMPENCYIVPGYFEDTLSDQFKKGLLNEKRSICFAFIDCNITSSYELVFDFVFDLMAKTGFVYMDEYFINADVPGLYRKFCDRLRDERGIESYYMRNAGGFGALFRLLPQGVADDQT